MAIVMYRCQSCGGLHEASMRPGGGAVYLRCIVTRVWAWHEPSHFLTGDASAPAKPNGAATAPKKSAKATKPAVSRRAPARSAAPRKPAARKAAPRKAAGKASARKAKPKRRGR